MTDRVLDDAREPIAVGRIGAPHGVRGWVRVSSDTDPPDAIAVLSPWLIASGEGDWSPVVPEHAVLNGRHMIAKLRGVDDRDAAAALTGRDIAVPRAVLPEAGEGEYYWCDLVGLRVESVDGRSLGEVQRLFETGSNDVMVVGPEQYLVPFLPGQVVKDVDLGRRLIRIDWDVDYLKPGGQS